MENSYYVIGNGGCSRLDERYIASTLSDAEAHLLEFGDFGYGAGTACITKINQRMEGQAFLYYVLGKPVPSDRYWAYRDYVDLEREWARLRNG